MVSNFGKSVLSALQLQWANANDPWRQIVRKRPSHCDVRLSPAGKLAQATPHASVPPQIQPLIPQQLQEP